LKTLQKKTRQTRQGSKNFNSGNMKANIFRNVTDTRQENFIGIGLWQQQLG
jgi:hypothetical protein